MGSHHLFFVGLSNILVKVVQTIGGTGLRLKLNKKQTMDQCAITSGLTEGMFFVVYKPNSGRRTVKTSISLAVLGITVVLTGK